METYIFPAVFTYNSDGIEIHFPDLPEAITFAENDIEAVKNAKEVLFLALSTLEEENHNIPLPTPINKLELLKNQTSCLVEVWMPYYRALTKTAYVKKTLTIPNYLNVIAEHNKINFSLLLQNAIKEKLGLK